jgi:hypothetical protein
MEQSIAIHGPPTDIAITIQVSITIMLWQRSAAFICEISGAFAGIPKAPNECRMAEFGRDARGNAPKH